MGSICSRPTGHNAGFVRGLVQQQRSTAFFFSAALFIVTSSFWAFHLWKKPYVHDLDNKLESISHGALAFTSAYVLSLGGSGSSIRITGTTG